MQKAVDNLYGKDGVSIQIRHSLGQGYYCTLKGAKEDISDLIRRMVRDLNFDIEIVGCPIVREADGLAMSSRNTYLNEEERKAALVLSQAVRLGEELIEAGEKNAAVIKEKMIANIEAEPLAKIDYVEIVDAQSLEPVSEIQGEILSAMAVYIGKTRLIDNFIR